MSGLANRYELIPIDRRSVPGRSIVRARLTSRHAARRALRGAHMVVDLAANPHLEQPRRSALRNIRVTWNTLEAAAEAGVTRYVYASSCHVMAGYERDEPYASVLAGRLDGLDPQRIPLIRTSDPPRPDGPYALGKVLGEAAGRYFADTYGMSVIVLRLGAVTPDGRPHGTRQLSIFLSYGDLVRLVSCCLDAPDHLRFATFFGVSDNTWRIWDIDDAREEIGYAPSDNAEPWREQT